jgi:hypothetical protein
MLKVRDKPTIITKKIVTANNSRVNSRFTIIVAHGFDAPVSAVRDIQTIYTEKAS